MCALDRESKRVLTHPPPCSPPRTDEPDPHAYDISTGKTTLLNVLAEQVPASPNLDLAGRLFVNGRSVGEAGAGGAEHTQVGGGGLEGKGLEGMWKLWLEVGFGLRTRGWMSLSWWDDACANAQLHRPTSGSRTFSTRSSPCGRRCSCALLMPSIDGLDDDARRSPRPSVTRYRPILTQPTKHRNTHINQRAARLRLPGSLTLKEKYDIVEALMKRMGLAKAADTVVGDEKVRNCVMGL